MSNIRKRLATGPRNDRVIKKKFDFIHNAVGARFLIPSKAAGSMIGRGGEIIKKIRAEFPDCRILVPDSNGPERVVIIDGTNELIANVWNHVLPTLKDMMNAKECDFKTKEGKSNQNEEEFDLRLLAHETIVGSIIGRGGERVKGFIDKHTMTMLKISLQVCPMSTDRVIRLVGSQDNLLECLKDVLAVLDEQVLKAPRDDYDPNNYDESLAHQYGGFISKDHRYPVRGNMDRPHDMEPRGSNYGRDSDPRMDDNLNSMRQFLMGNGRRSPFENSAPDLLNGVMKFPAPNDFGIYMSKISVQPIFVDAIVGRDGHRLSDIKHDSGANIELNIDRFTEENIFIIEGTADQIFKAQCLMQLCARKYGERERERNPYMSY